MPVRCLCLSRLAIFSYSAVQPVQPSIFKKRRLAIYNPLFSLAASNLSNLSNLKPKFLDFRDAPQRHTRSRARGKKVGQVGQVGQLIDLAADLSGQPYFRGWTGWTLGLDQALQRSGIPPNSILLSLGHTML